jgi:L-2-hydroxyglutarate oxidase LhgO
MSDRHYDLAIIGGGIIGVATARSLLDRPGLSIVVLEAESELARHQSGRNSGVIHAGLYYRPGSFKARLCTEGREELYRFCQEQEIPHRRCGKLVLATDESELPALEELETVSCASTPKAYASTSQTHVEWRRSGCPRPGWWTLPR